MSALQVTWLTNHFEQGKITEEEFTSLFRRITLAEQESERGTGSKSDQIHVVKKVARLHPETRRTLARVRTFKKLAKAVNYTLILALISLVYLSAEYYQITGELPNMSVAGLEKLITQTPRKPLPSDIKLAAEFLSQQSQWDESHVNQFSERWENTLSGERARYSGERWFQGLQLALALHIAEQRILAKTGNSYAIQQAVLLAQLAKLLEKESV